MGVSRIMAEPGPSRFEKVFTYLLIVSLVFPLSKVIGAPWSRIYLFDFSLGPLLFLWLSRLALGGKIKIRLTGLDILVALLLLWFMVSTNFSLDPDVSIDQFLLWLRGYILYLYFSRNFIKTVGYRSFLTLIILIFIIEGLLCVVQLATGTQIGAINQYFGDPHLHVGVYSFEDISIERATGTFGSPGILPIWIPLLFPHLFAYYLFGDSGMLKNWSLIASFVGMCGILATLSRTGLSAMIIGTSLVCYWVRSRIPFFKGTKKIKVRIVHFFVILFIFGFVLGVYLVLSDNLDLGLKRYSDIEQRMTISNIYLSFAWEIAFKKPYFGTGLGNFKLLLEETGFYILYRGQKKRLVHNVPSRIAAETGLIGFFLFVLLLLNLLRRAFRTIKNEPKDLLQVLQGGLLIGMIGMIWGMQWTSGFSTQVFLTLFFIILGIIDNLEIELIKKRSRTFDTN